MPSNTIWASFGREVSAAEEEAIDRVNGVANEGVVEFRVAGGVGGKVTEEVNEVGSVGAVGGESCCVWAGMVAVSCSSVSWGLAKEVHKHGEEQKGSSRLQRLKPMIATNLFLLAALGLRR